MKVIIKILSALTVVVSVPVIALSLLINFLETFEGDNWSLSGEFRWKPMFDNTRYARRFYWLWWRYWKVN